MTTTLPLLQAMPASALRRRVFTYPMKAAMLIVLLYAIILGGASALVWVGNGVPEVVRLSHELVVKAVPPTMAVAIGAYALLRVPMYSPLGFGAYPAWLAATPWRAGLPLPRGPATLVIEDLVPLATAVGLAIHTAGRDESITPTIVFALGYTLGSIASLARTRLSLFLYALAFGWPSVGLLEARAHVSAAIALTFAMVLAVEIGMRRGFRQFPYELRRRAEVKQADESRFSGQWLLGPKPPRAPIALSHGLLVPLVVAWGIFCGVASDDTLQRWNKDVTKGVGVAMLAGAVVAFVRWMTYCGTYQPPISTWGRLRTGRLIVPGYDAVLIAPLATLLVAIVVPPCLRVAEVPPASTFAVSCFATLAIALNLPPTLRRWQLTGHHHIAIRRTMTQKHQQARPLAGSAG